MNEKNEKNAGEENLCSDEKFYKEQGSSNTVNEFEKKEINKVFIHDPLNSAIGLIDILRNFLRSLFS